jgi:hypothetical protein
MVLGVENGPALVFSDLFITRDFKSNGFNLHTQKLRSAGLRRMDL